MNTRSTEITKPNWIGALQEERSTMLAFCEQLTPAEWAAPSLAAGWSIQDVLAHIGSGCHAMFSSSVVRLMASNDIEATNDAFVDDRRSWGSDQVLGEYRTWSGRVVTAARLLCRSPLRALPVPLAELGNFKLRLLLSGALTFDHHTHLRHDMAPALNSAPPETDANRIAVVLAWMFAVLGNQVKAAQPSWLDRPIGITLRGPGGGSWIADLSGTQNAVTREADTWITAQAIYFPEWGTRRAHWSDRDVTIVGDQNFGAAFLDFVNVV